MIINLDKPPPNLFQDTKRHWQKKEVNQWRLPVQQIKKMIIATFSTTLMA